MCPRIIDAMPMKSIRIATVPKAVEPMSSAEYESAAPVPVLARVVTFCPYIYT